jgi:thioredoxin-like negative regulator of GroEL
VSRDGAAIRARRQAAAAVPIARVNVDEEPVLAGRFAIRSIPTLVVLRDGEPVAAESGVIGAMPLVDALDRIDAATPVAAGAR